jgi:signal transduction histidine kinase
MRALKQLLLRIPFWAYLLVLTVIIVNSVYMYWKCHVPDDGLSYDLKNGQWIVVNYHPNSPGYSAGIRRGDIILSVNSKPFATWLDGYQGKRTGDTGNYQVLRANRHIQIQVLLGSYFSNVTGFFWSLFIVMLLFNITSLYLLSKKPHDKAVMLFFVYLQLFTVTMNAWSIPFQDLTALLATNIFAFITCQLGPVLIHFHLLFPKPFQLLRRFKVLPLIFYIIGTLVFILIKFPFVTALIDALDLIWLSLTFLLAMATAIYRFLTVKDTLTRNQLRIIIIGSFFGFIIPVLYRLLFFSYVNHQDNFLYTVMIPHGIGSMIMICCILIAIFRYRIWDIEVLIRKALLYLGATLVIILTYLCLIWIVDRLIISENNFVRFVILGVSVIIFLVLRDRIQRLIDRLFHRETYDSATVVSDFENKLAGIYRYDELKQKIVQGIDEIFHFKSFVFTLKKHDLIYEPAFVYGMNDRQIREEIEITTELEEKLRRSKVFSPEELNNKPLLLEISNGELIIPLVSGNQPNGFFICGQKKSERIYSRQDINVLTLLARRVIALLHTANLYQKDLDRQLMLEKERARISQDMHDDIGAGLTRIAMISEAPVKASDRGREIRERMAKVASSSRDMISRLNVIVWALNPQYDNLDSLVTYMRRYFGEYLENFGIRFKNDLPVQIPEISITPDARRNIFYAVQEAIHNAVKHGACSEICLIMNIHGQNIGITVTDNGKGFENIKTGSGGNGLLNMRKRAEELGGTFEIQSAPGKGTKVIFNVKI